MQKAEKRHFLKKVLFKKQIRNKRKVKESIQKLDKKEKDKIKEYQRKRYQQMIQYKKEALQNKWPLLLLSIKTSEKTLKFGNIRVKKTGFQKSKQPIDLDLINVDQIVMSDKFKHSDDDFKYFIGYKEDEIVKPLCIILPQMTGYIKYFENGGKNMSFMVKNDMHLDKYKWNLRQNWKKVKHKISQHACLWWKIHKSQSKKF